MKVRVIFVGCSFMSKINLELLVLTVKTVKKNPVVWVIPLLLMLILSKLIIYPREWIRFWSINRGYLKTPQIIINTEKSS
jgi:hypothetical protein